MASARLLGSGLMPRALRSREVSDQTSSSASRGSSYPSSMPFSPAASISANARYGFASESSERNSTREDWPLCGLYIGTRTSADRLLCPQEMNDGASSPTASRLYEFTHWFVTAVISE